MDVYAWPVHIVMKRIVFPQNLYVEALTPKVTIFGKEVFKDIIIAKWGYKGRALSNMIGVLKRRERDPGERQRENAIWEGGHLQSKERGIRRILMFDFQAPEMWETYSLSHCGENGTFRPGFPPGLNRAYCIYNKSLFAHLWYVYRWQSQTKDTREKIKNYWMDDFYGRFTTAKEKLEK